MLWAIIVLFLVLFLTTGHILEGLEVLVVNMIIVVTENPENFHKYRKILVSPTTNTTKPFEGFRGYCSSLKKSRLGRHRYLSNNGHHIGSTVCVLVFN